MAAGRERGIPYHYLVETNTTGYCTDAAITSWMGGWPTQCALETAQSALHTLFVLCVFQFALGMLRRGGATAPDAPAPARNAYYGSDAMRLGLALAAVMMWLGSVLYHGLAKLTLPPYHTLLMVTSATAWICYLTLSMELDVTSPQVSPSLVYRWTKALWLAGQLSLGLAIAFTSKLGDFDDSVNDDGNGNGNGLMAAAATQQFTLVVQLGINFATACLELFRRTHAPTANMAATSSPVLAEQASRGGSQHGRSAVQAALNESVHDVTSEPIHALRAVASGTSIHAEDSAMGTGAVGPSNAVDGHGTMGMQRLAIRLYFVCSGFGTRMMWYSLNVALPYFTQLYGPEVYPRMLLGYNLGALASLFGQVLGDARFDALYGPSVTTCFRVNLGLGCMFLLMLYFPHTANRAWIPVALSAAVGVLDYFATGSLTQMASRVGGIVPTFFFLGQALSGAFLFGFTSSVDWSVEEMAVDNVQHYKHSHQDVVAFFGYASSFILIGQVAFNFLISSDLIKQVHGVPMQKPWYYHRCRDGADTHTSASLGNGGRDIRQPLLADADGAADEDVVQHGLCEQLQQSMLAFRLTWPLQTGIVVLWVSLLSVQALFGLDKGLQEPLMFVNLFGLMTGMQLNVLFSKKLDGFVSPKALFAMICAVMPTFALVYTLQTLGAVALLDRDYLRVGATACFYIVGGSSWMLCYTLCVEMLHTDELRTEATRLLNLLTQAGILAGVGIGMILVDAVHQYDDAGSNQNDGSTAGADAIGRIASVV